MSDGANRQFREINAQLRQSVLMIALALVLGIVGYVVIEGWSFLDSLFMTVITLSSVGYGEIRPLDTAGRVFTIILIITGVAALGNLVSQLARAFTEGYFVHGLQHRRRHKMISRLDNHFIVCGYGRIGQQICKDFELEGASFVVIERSPELVKQAEEAGYVALNGDASQDEILQQAGIERARSLLCALPSDAESLYTILSAKALNPRLTTIARVSSEEGATKLARVGVDKIVSPYLTGAKHMAALALRPQVVDFTEASQIGEGRVYIEQILLKGATHCPCLGMTLIEAGLRKKTGVLILAIQRASGEFIGGPKPHTRIEQGDMLICMGSGDQLRRLNELLLPPQKVA